MTVDEFYKRYIQKQSPGYDGLSAEICKVFWTDIWRKLTNVIKHSFKRGELSLSQSRGGITLLHKKCKIEDNLPNWRPSLTQTTNEI